jgi:hypothetical protein
MQYSLCIDSIYSKENLEERLTRIKQAGFKFINPKGRIPPVCVQARTGRRACPWVSTLNRIIVNKMI